MLEAEPRPDQERGIGRGREGLPVHAEERAPTPFAVEEPAAVEPGPDPEGPAAVAGAAKIQREPQQVRLRPLDLVQHRHAFRVAEGGQHLPDEHGDEREVPIPQHAEDAPGIRLAGQRSSRDTPARRSSAAAPAGARRGRSPRIRRERRGSCARPRAASSPGRGHRRTAGRAGCYARPASARSPG